MHHGEVLSLESCHFVKIFVEFAIMKRYKKVIEFIEVIEYKTGVLTTFLKSTVHECTKSN